MRDSSCERLGKTGDMSNFETEQIVGAHLAGESVTTAALLGVLKATVSTVMSAYTNRGKTTSMKRCSG
jgi:uncharacterized membrane protein (DUF485 family)